MSLVVQMILSLSVGMIVIFCKWKSVSQIAIHFCIYLYAILRNILIPFLPLYVEPTGILSSNSGRGDPIILDIIRSMDVATSVLVGDVINLEKELSTNISVGEALVQSTQFVHTTKLTEEQRENQQSSKFPDMHIVGPWSNVVTDLDYIQDPPSWSGLGSSNVEVSKEVLNPNVAHDLAILQQHVWNGNDARGIGPRVYTDEEENAAAINYLKNCFAADSAVTEEPFIEVVSKAKKKKVQKGFQVHNTRSKGKI